MTTPTNGIAVEGNLVRVQAVTTDDVQVRNVEFYLDGKKVMIKRQPPYTLDLDFGNVPQVRRVRAVALNEFYRMPGDTPEQDTVIRTGELITAVLLPPAGDGERSHYLKVRDRAEFEFALVSAAVVVAPDGDRIRGAALHRATAE